MKQGNGQKGRTQQYILTGAALGIYFGWFFRPLQEPSIATVLLLSFAAAFVTTVLRFVRKDREQIIRRALTTWFSFAVVMAVLAARHFAYEYGGRMAVVAMTTIFGALAGYRMAIKGSESLL